MMSKITHKNSRIGEKVKVTPLIAGEQGRRIQEAMARRAYEIFERRGGAGWHELEDWCQAESELLRPCSCGEMTLNGSLWLGTDASMFEEGTVEIWVAPRRITICGKPRTEKEREANGERRAEMLYHVVNLPIEVEPSGVTTRFRGRSLEIVLQKAQAKSPHAMAKVA
jgi:hypothetical protein